MTIPTDRPGTALLVVDVQGAVVERSIRRDEAGAKTLMLKACGPDPKTELVVIAEVTVRLRRRLRRVLPGDRVRRHRGHAVHAG